MDLSGQRELLPHYLAVAAVASTAAVLARSAGGNWVALVSVLVVVLSYPTVVRALNVAPEAWEQR
ncbi:hypothetical protein BRD06_00750 [Halobacteriales archaeon QS_9_67_15]|nr:MAG: hypothetical protein BRD06_00750 [Halobacteriales archaeon QS_9_67_15]